MSFITLEYEIEGGEVEVTVPVVVHVTKHLDRFVFNDTIQRANVPLSYLETPKTDSWKNTLVLDRTYSVPANAPKEFDPHYSWREHRSSTVSSRYRDVLITDQYLIGREGERHPLWWKHKLPQGTVECSVVQTQEGNDQPIEGGYLIDLDKAVVYFEQTNWFNPDTGSYRVWQITSTNEDGEVEATLANMEPVCGEATWEDVDPDTGLLYEGILAFTREETGAGWTFYLPRSAAWFIRPQSKSGIRPLLPQNKQPTESWYARFSAGKFKALVNGTLRTYSIPEWDALPFFPSKPILHVSSKQALWVSSTLLYLSQPNVVVNLDTDLHIEVLAYGTDDVLKKAYTTDADLEGTRYQDTEVFYESDKIAGWDQESGLVLMGIDLLPGQEYWVQYSYESRDFEVPVDLNPIFNKKSLGLSYIYYLVPDQTETALYWLAVDSHGTIKECSQPEFKLLDSMGNWNPDTLIGSKYWDESDPSFLSLYCVGTDNAFQYYVLAEYSVLENDLIENILVVDVQRNGGLDPDQFANAVRTQPKLLQSQWGYGELGQEVPMNNVVVVQVPLSFTEEYGGQLTREQAEALLQEQSAVGVMLLFDWTYPKTVLSGYSIVATTVTLSCTWEGPDLTYTLFARPTDSDVWVQIDSEIDPVEGTVTFTDTQTSGETWWYGVKITKDGIEYPFGNLLAVKVA